MAVMPVAGAVQLVFNKIARPETDTMVGGRGYCLRAVYCNGDALTFPHSDTNNLPVGHPLFQIHPKAYSTPPLPKLVTCVIMSASPLPPPSIPLQT